MNHCKYGYSRRLPVIVISSAFSNIWVVEYWGEIFSLSHPPPLIFIIMEVRQLSSKVAAAHGTLQPHHQYGLFATTACSEGDVILTESSPLLSSSSSISVRSQFKASSLATPPPAATANAASAFEFGESKSSTDGKILSPILSDLILPQKQLSSLSSYDKDFDAVTRSQRISKLRGMILALASYAANQPSEEAKEKLLKLHYPSIKSPESYKKGSPTKDAIILAQAAMFCPKKWLRRKVR